MQLQLNLCGCDSLTFQYQLYCDANYYSSDCSVYCVASDTDAGGHYTCDPATGRIICRPGTRIRVRNWELLQLVKTFLTWIHWQTL